MFYRRSNAAPFRPNTSPVRPHFFFQTFSRKRSYRRISHPRVCVCHLANPYQHLPTFRRPAPKRHLQHTRKQPRTQYKSLLPASPDTKLISISTIAFMSSICLVRLRAVHRKTNKIWWYTPYLLRAFLKFFFPRSFFLQGLGFGLLYWSVSRLSHLTLTNPKKRNPNWQSTLADQVEGFCQAQRLLQAGLLRCVYRPGIHAVLLVVPRPKVVPSHPAPDMQMFCITVWQSDHSNWTKVRCWFCWPCFRQHVE